MPCLSDEEDVQLPSDLNYITQPTERRKCGAERVSFGGEGLISAPSPVKEIKFESRDRLRSRALNDHTRSEHPLQGSTQASHVWTRQLNSQANRVEKRRESLLA
jgi:hypothetical protein